MSGMSGKAIRETLTALPEFGGLLFRTDWPLLPESLADLDPAERTRLDGFMWLVVRHGDMAFYQYDRGLLAAERLESATISLRRTLEFPLARDWWEDARSFFVPEYQDYVDGIIATQP